MKAVQLSKLVKLTRPITGIYRMTDSRQQKLTLFHVAKIDPMKDSRNYPVPAEARHIALSELLGQPTRLAAA